MIFITVGGQMPFDRLIKAVDNWAAYNSDELCFAQIGRNGWQPHHMKWVELLEPNNFREKVNQSDLIIAHAGMGTILSALDFGKRIIVMPRRGDLNETRNDHQISTANRLESIGLVIQASDETKISTILDKKKSIISPNYSSINSNNLLINAIRKFLQE